MKEKIKEKFNEAKEYVINNKENIITGCFVTAICWGTAAICGRYIGEYIAKINTAVYHKGVQKGMSDFYVMMVTDNADKPEVIKSLVDFELKHTVDGK